MQEMHQFRAGLPPHVKIKRWRLNWEQAAELACEMYEQQAVPASSHADFMLGLVYGCPNILGAPVEVVAIEVSRRSPQTKRMSYRDYARKYWVKP